MLNTQFGLKSVMDNMNLYKKLLTKLDSQLDAVIPTINEALSNNDMELAQRTAHSIKGASASLGAEDLSKCAASLEGAFKNGLEFQNIILELTTQIQKTKHEINDFLSTK